MLFRSKADTLKPAPEGIKPEWYFLFMFQTLKRMPEALGVALLALGGGFLLLAPFVDRRAARDERDHRLTALFLAMLTYVLIFEFWAWLTPGAQSNPETLQAETYDRSAGGILLFLFWCAIVFLVVYLRRLGRENARIRRLYQATDVAPASARDGGTVGR